MKIFIFCLFIVGLFAVDEVDKMKISKYFKEGVEYTG